jgi:DNA-binding transcriptional regulator LsrR (DeoR family)
MDADKLAAARARREPAKIAKALGVSRASVYRHLAAEASKPGLVRFSICEGSPQVAASRSLT